mmetsp:Transcript_108372/g.215218  ORF Transcript_108372/g.215218 Transcript_108372/m.215218 type:complete len:214 (+) Transcript_108372:52-693(+)
MLTINCYGSRPSWKMEVTCGQLKFQAAHGLQWQGSNARASYRSGNMHKQNVRAHAQAQRVPCLKSAFDKKPRHTFLPGKRGSSSLLTATGMHNARFKKRKAGASGEIFINDHMPTPANVMQKAKICVRVMASPKRTHESATMTMSLVRPVRTKPTAETSLITVAVSTFSKKATPALTNNSRQCAMAAGMMTEFQAMALPTRRTTKQVGATKAV